MVVVVSEGSDWRMIGSQRRTSGERRRSLMSNERTRPSTSTNTRAQEEHQQRRSQEPQAPNKILLWMQQLEKINANQPDEFGARKNEVNRAASYVAANGTGPPKTTTTTHHTDGTQAEFKLSGCQPSAQVGVNNDLCFKAAQLTTEFVLMLFAASLLFVAALVILSKRTPALMESFEIVPKILFILCVIVATCSFSNWIITRVKSRCEPECELAKVIAPESFRIIDGSLLIGSSITPQSRTNTGSCTVGTSALDTVNSVSSPRQAPVNDNANHDLSNSTAALSGESKVKQELIAQESTTLTAPNNIIVEES